MATDVMDRSARADAGADRLHGAAEAAALDELDLILDIANTVRRDPSLAAETDATRRDRLREIYRRQGIALDDRLLDEGVAAYRSERFGYAPRKGAFTNALGHAYVVRRGWLPVATSVLIALVIGLGGYYLVYTPWHRAQLSQLETELEVAFPARMDELYQAIYDETKVQRAVIDAAAIRDQGKAAAAAGDRAGALSAIAGLQQISDTLQAEYRIVIVSRPGEKWGFWTFPENNSEATNYYLVVEGVGADGKPVPVPVTDEQTGRTETVSKWAIRVTEPVYRSVERDAADDGNVQAAVIGVKDYGFLDVDFTIPVLGGTLTRW
jgi:hypothetical protein